jgi:hypothetical protein
MKSVTVKDILSQRTYNHETICISMTSFYTDIACEVVFDSWSHEVGSIHFDRQLFQKRGNKK